MDEAGKPSGSGVYRWSNGNVYDGTWLHGLKHGRGVMVWSSGATYAGDWWKDKMHGVGEYTAVDTTHYQGSWNCGVRQGLGRQTFPNGDVYEGLWKEGVPHGPGSYKWSAGDEYNGRWIEGRMCGWGTLVLSAKGDRYDGEWRGGREHGAGVYTWGKSGATYSGTWRWGRKHGLGIWAPALERRVKKNCRRVTKRVLHMRKGSEGARLSSVVEEGDDVHEVSGSAGEGARGDIRRIAISSDSEIEPDEALAGSDGGGDRDLVAAAGKTPSAPVVSTCHGDKNLLLCEYNDGAMIREEIIEASMVQKQIHRHPVASVALDQMTRAVAAVSSATAKVTGMRKVRQVSMGETIFKGHRSYELMLQLQLGVRWSVGRNHSPPIPEVLHADAVEHELKQSFPRSGSSTTPPHPAGDFMWKEYSPSIFRRLRQLWEVDPGDFMLSLCADQALRELSSPGKSGSVFYISQDDRFIIKTVRKHEEKKLCAMLQRYYEHVSEHPDSLLTKFFGLYRVKPKGGRKVRFVIMGNLFCTHLVIHDKYDLKGSTLGRYTQGSVTHEKILKDLDLTHKFRLEAGARDKLMRTLAEDCALLEELRVMDYSLLVGVHFRRTTQPESTGKMAESDMDSGGSSDGNDGSEKLEKVTGMIRRLSDSFSGGRGAGLAWRRPSLDDVLSIAPARTPDNRPSPGDAGGCDAIAHAVGEKEVRVGVNTVAVAVPGRVLPVPRGVAKFVALDPVTENTVVDKSEGGEEGIIRSSDVVLHFGIIDILQEYNHIKNLETVVKGAAYGQSVISSVDPVTYSRRFQTFLRRVFE